MATIVDVARLAGVSTSTVSHVLNDTRPVEPDTRQRVLEALERTAYRQDALARALRRSRTDSIGLVVSDAGEPAFADMVHGVGQAATRLGLTLLLANSAEDSSQELKAVQALLERRVDGLILARAAASDRKLVDLIAEERTPIVLLDRVFPALRFDQVAAENQDPMTALVGHMFAAGHRRFCVIAGDTRVPSLAERLNGFTLGCGALGLNPDEQLVLGGPGPLPDLRDRIDAAVASGERASAFIACSTVLAAETLQAFQAAGLRTPRDVAFATFDGFSHPDLFEPRITTVRQPAFDVGTTAVQLLQDRIRAAAVPRRLVRLQQTIEYRESTEGFVAAN
jgi:LacI family transcriptional regulator